jgi:hypothetical protein
LAQAQVAADAARNNPSFLAAEVKAKVEEETHTAEEVAFASTKAAKQEAAVASAKHTAEVRAKEAHQEAAAAKEEAAAKTTAEVEAAAAVKRQAEAIAKADAQAEAADKHSNAEAQAREAFFERLPFAAAKAKLDKIKAANMVSAKHQVATTNLPGLPMSDTDEDISDSEANAAPAFTHDPATVASLMEMGFPEARVHAALDGVHSNNVELATEWLFSHADVGDDEESSLAAAIAPPLTASGGEGSVVHQYVTSAELAAQIAMWQDVGDTENKFCASKLSLGNPSESDLREMLGLEAHILKSHYIVDI